LKKLIQLAGDPKEPSSARAIAVHDLGQYIKFNPKGRKILDELGGKACMMRLIADSEPTVKYEALMALQKYMVNRW
jgi:V-type H+-transporting ATPase subunit H